MNTKIKLPLKSGSPPDLFIELDDTDLKIIYWLAHGLGLKQIEDKVNLGYSCVHHRVCAMYKGAGCQHCHTALVIFAFDNGILVKENGKIILAVRV